MNQNQEMEIARMLDGLMMAKNRPLLTDDAKEVWLEDLKDEEFIRIRWAINKIRRTVGPFPECAAVLEACREYAVVHAHEIAEYQKMKFLEDNIEKSKQLESSGEVKKMTINEARKMLMDRT